MTQQKQRAFARVNLLQTCYGETGVMDFGLKRAPQLLVLATVDSLVVTSGE